MAIKDDWAKGDKFTAADANTVAAAVNASVPNTRKVAGKALSADVTLTKSDVGLGNVDNTRDADKPISTAVAAALAGMADGSSLAAVDGGSANSVYGGTTSIDGGMA